MAVRFCVLQSSVSPNLSVTILQQQLQRSGCRMYLKCRLVTLNRLAVSEPLI